MDAQRQNEQALAPRPILRRDVPHTRCGICDQPFESGDDAIYVDDERCHLACARGDT